MHHVFLVGCGVKSGKDGVEMILRPTKRKVLGFYVLDAGWKET